MGLKHATKKIMNDEFYTQYKDIEKFFDDKIDFLKIKKSYYLVIVMKVIFTNILKIMVLTAVYLKMYLMLIIKILIL